MTKRYRVLFAFVLVTAMAVGQLLASAPSPPRRQLKFYALQWPDNVGFWAHQTNKLHIVIWYDGVVVVDKILGAKDKFGDWVSDQSFLAGKPIKFSVDILDANNNIVQPGTSTYGTDGNGGRVLDFQGGYPIASWGASNGVWPGTRKFYVWIEDNQDIYGYFYVGLKWDSE